MSAVAEPTHLLPLTAREIDALLWMLTYFDNDLENLDGYDVYRDEIPTVRSKLARLQRYV